MLLQDSGVAFRLTMKNGVRLLLAMYLVDATPAMLPGNLRPHIGYLWNLWLRCNCSSGCTGPILVAAQRPGPQHGCALG